MPEPLILTLRAPIQTKSGPVSELRLREPRAGEVMIASRETGNRLARALLCQVTGLDDAAADAVPVSVSRRALDYLTSFLTPLTETTQTENEEPPPELTVHLAAPMEIGTATVQDITAREPTLGEMIKSERYDGMLRQIQLAALVTGLPRAVVEQVPISVFSQISGYLNRFTDAAPANGGESSEI